MKILFYVPYFHNGGIEQLVKSIVTYSNKEYDFDLMIESKSPNLKKNSLHNIFNNVYIVRAPEQNPVRYFLDIFKIISRENYDIVVSHNFYRSPILFKVSKKFGIEHRVFQAHSVERPFENSLIKRFIFKRNFVLATNLLAVSEKAGSALFGNRTFHIIPNAVDVNKFVFDQVSRNKLLDKFGFNSEDIILGYTARFERDKNHEYLLNLLKILPNNYKMVFVGYGSYKKKLESLIKLEKLENRIYLVENPKNVEDYYNIFDIFLFPSLYEGFGNVTLEAISSGLIVIKNSEIPSPKGELEERILDLDLNYDYWKLKIIEISKKINTYRSYSFRKEGIKLIRNSGYDSESIFKKYKLFFDNLVESDKIIQVQMENHREDK